MCDAIEGVPLRRIDFQCSGAVSEAISRLGRTEDIRFSPDNRLLAIAGFHENKLLCLAVDIQGDADRPRVTIESFVEITSAGIQNVHGLDFIDNRTLAVANRNSDVAIIRLPDAWLADQQVSARVLRRVKGPRWRRISSPGSVVVTRLPRGSIRILVCNNYARRVTEHLVSPKLGFFCWRNKHLLREGLNIPDGIAVQPLAFFSVRSILGNT